MNLFEVAKRPPRHAQVLVLEDDNRTARQLEDVLSANYDARVYVALDMKAYYQLFESRCYEALSIDWDLRGSVGGSSALNKAAARHSPAGCIVYTNYPQVRDEAKRFGANEVIEKNNIFEFQAAFERAARYGFAREIIARFLPGESPISYPLQPDVEERMCRTFLDEAVRRRSTAHTELLELLARRGWVSDSDSFHIAGMSWGARILYFSKLCAYSVENLAVMLRADPQDIENRLKGELPGSWDDPVVRGLDDFSSLGAYTFRLAGQHPELVQFYWRIQNLFPREDTAPPWNRTGIADFVASTGAKGLDAALRWIRSH
jgi:hypothetical protein